MAQAWGLRDISQWTNMTNVLYFNMRTVLGVSTCNLHHSQSGHGEVPKVSSAA